MPRPARQRIAEIGASGNAVLGVRIGVVRLDPERLDRLQFEYKFQSLRARRLDIVIGAERAIRADAGVGEAGHEIDLVPGIARSEEHTSELQSLMRISYAVFCLKKKRINR